MKSTPALLAIGLSAFAIAAAPVSQADPGDASFVQQLNAAGIPMADPPSLVGNTGRTICSLLEANWTVNTASYSAKAEYPSLTDSQARNFVLISAKNYCPNL